MTGERAAPAADGYLLQRARDGDEEAFLRLAGRYHAVLIRIALCYVGRSTAEAIARDAWRAVISEPQLAGDEHSLETRLFRLVAECARSRAGDSDGCAAVPRDVDSGSSVVEGHRFFPAGHRWAGHWSTTPRPFPPLVDRAVYEATATCVRAALDGLDDLARLVVTLRDVCGWNSDEVWEATGTSPIDQRAWLHLARARIRAALERHHAGEPAPFS